jgi:DNA-directed RNA polymerase subunit RPC12/RpoP
MPSGEYVCQWCGQSLTFSHRGWVHQDGGIYAMRCPDCGWQGARYPSPVRCPRCESRALRDDHCAQPVRS